jgi:hypothetical protein
VVTHTARTSRLGGAAPADEKAIRPTNKVTMSFIIAREGKEKLLYLSFPSTKTNTFATMQAVRFT